MLTLVTVTAFMALEGEAVRRLTWGTASECWELWRLSVTSQSTRICVIKEPSTSCWVTLMKTWLTDCVWCSESAETHHLTSFCKCTQFNQTCLVFSGILMQMEVRPDEEDAITLEIKSDIQLILSVLCETDMHRKVLRSWDNDPDSLHCNNLSSSTHMNKCIIFL